MAKANLIQKKIIVGKEDIILFQIMTYCFLNDLKISHNEMLCIMDLALNGESDLSEYCMNASEKNFFTSSQSVRNFLCKAEKYGLVVKKGDKKTKVSVGDIGIKTEGNIIFNLNLIYAVKEDK